MSYASDLLEPHRGNLVSKIAEIWLAADPVTRIILGVLYPFLMEGNEVQHRPKPAEIKAWLDSRQTPPDYFMSDDTIPFRVDYEGFPFQVHVHADTGEMICASLGDFTEIQHIMTPAGRVYLETEAKEMWDKHMDRLKADSEY